MKDILNIDLEIGDIILAPSEYGVNLIFGKVVGMIDNKVELIINNNTYNTITINSIQVINVKHSIYEREDVNELINSINSTERTYIQNKAEAEKELALKKLEKRKTTKDSTPGKLYVTPGGAIVLYVGVINKMHRYMTILRSYKYSSDDVRPDYLFYIGSKSNIALKSKKIVAKEFKESKDSDYNLDISASFRYLKTQINGNGARRSWNDYGSGLSIADVELLEAEYNKNKKG